jgi:hypothetical protein
VTNNQVGTLGRAARRNAWREELGEHQHAANQCATLKTSDQCIHIRSLYQDPAFRSYLPVRRS